MKKQDLINKIVKKDFNNELEIILEQKEFSENVKSALLNILYKIESWYKDAQTVKIDIDTKEGYINRLISIINNKCKSIKMIKMNSKNSKISENGTFFIDKENGIIQCYPIERKLLYAIWKISKNEDIIKSKYGFINDALSDLLNVGNTIDLVEPLRDFNGYSWTTVNTEIESIEHNLIYQNLRMLVGNKFLNKWIYNKEFIMDYYTQFIEKLRNLYGKENEKKIIELLINISILLKVKFKDEKFDIYQKEKEKVESELKNIKDRKQFIEKITNEKLQLSNQIKEIDQILSNKKLLEKEYKKRNEKLPLDKKIFSMRVLSDLMIREREGYYKEIEEKNNLLNPKKFVEYNKQLKYKQKYLELLNIEDIQKELNKYLLDFQKIFLVCFQKNIKKAETKQQLMDLIYEIRYYMQLPINRENKIYDYIEDKILKPTLFNLLNKSIEQKVIQKFTKNDDIFYFIWKKIFTLRVINLNEISFKIVKNKDKYEMQIYDDDLFEEKIELESSIKDNLKESGIKLNKKQKIFE